jgi:hypothetical protein
MSDRDIPAAVAQALLEHRYCVPDASPTLTLEWWLIGGAILLALAWSWPSISAFRRWLREQHVASVVQLSCFQLDGWRNRILSPGAGESSHDWLNWSKRQERQVEVRP